MITQKSKLKDSVREGLVILISILVAFGLDAWWEQWGESRLESDIVRSLQTEFQANRQRLVEDIRRVETYTEATTRVLNAIQNQARHPPDGESIAADLWKTLSWRTSNLITGTLDAVISAGQLELVQDTALRAALGGWSAQLQDMAEEEEFEWREITERYRPHLGSLIAIPSLEVNESPAVPSHEEISRLLNDPEFRSHLAWRLDVSLVSLKAKQELLVELDRILELLNRAP